MSRGQARIATATTLVAAYAAWHLTGGMHGTVVRVHTPSDAALTISAITTSQCQDLAATPAATASAALSPAPSPSSSPTPTPSPSPSVSPAQLCISVQAAQNHATRGTTAAWTVQVWDQSGPAASVTVTVAASGGRAPVFTASCPGGAGTSTCALGDMGTSVTPLSYQLQAQVSIPAASTAQSLTVTAQADTTPPMPASAAAGQSVAITGTTGHATPKPSPKRTTATHRASAPPVTPAVPQPTIARPVALPTIGPLPTPGPITTTVPAGSISTVLPQLTPAVATVAAPAAISSTSLTSPAANVQAIGASSSPATDGQAFSVSIGMTARTAQVLGFILLILIFILTTAKLTGSHFTLTRPRFPRTAIRPRRWKRSSLAPEVTSGQHRPQGSDDCGSDEV